MILSIMSIIYRRLMYVTFDDKQASVSGINVKLINYIFIVLSAITVVTSIRLVGVLLISALIVLPNITALLFGRGFKKTALISVCLAIGSVVFGIVVSYIVNVPPAGAVVLVNVGVFLGSILVRGIIRSIQFKRMHESKIQQ
jgi:zinc transport system permease protein